MKKKEAVSVSAAPKPDHDYESENAMRTLMDAEKIKQDPVMMKKIGPHLKKHAKAIRSIQDIHDAYNAKMRDERGDGDAEDKIDGGADEAKEK